MFKSKTTTKIGLSKSEARGLCNEIAVDYSQISADFYRLAVELNCQPARVQKRYSADTPNKAVMVFHFKQEAALACHLLHVLDQKLGTTCLISSSYDYHTKVSQAMEEFYK